MRDLAILDEAMQVHREKQSGPRKQITKEIKAAGVRPDAFHAAYRLWRADEGTRAQYDLDVLRCREAIKIPAAQQKLALEGEENDENYPTPP